jgi:hypothetical protein
MSNKLPNIIFLDFDGVICNPRACLATRQDGMYSYLDPIACLLVKRLCEDNNAKLVISSSWRIGHDLDYIQSVLNAACPSLGNFVWNSQTWWRTTSNVFSNDSGNCNRGLEINHWMNNHEDEFEHFVILDDNSDMEPHMNKLVQTCAYDGFGYMDYMRAECLLNGRKLQE